MTTLVRTWTHFVTARRVRATRERLVKLVLAYLNRLPPCCM